MQPHIGIAYLDQIDSQTIEDFKSTVSSDGVNVEARSRPSGIPFASIELVASTAIVVYIFKPYFESILQEAGKDHYEALKAALGSLGLAVFGKVKVIQAGGKVKEKLRYSPALSMIADTESGPSFKLLFTESMSESQVHVAVSLFLEFVEAFHRQQISEEMYEQLKGLKHVGGTIPLTYDEERQRLVVVDPLPSRIRE